MELEIQGHIQPTAKVEFLEGLGCARDQIGIGPWPGAIYWRPLLSFLICLATIDTPTNL